MLDMAGRLRHLCAKLSSVVTIYGDTICISGSRAIVGHESTFLRIAKTSGFRARREKTLVASPSQDKVISSLIIREGKPTVSDDDLALVSALVVRCAELGAQGLAGRVCRRYAGSLRGLVDHYAWIDAKRMAHMVHRFARIAWPVSYDRSDCMAAKCFCSPL